MLTVPEALKKEDDMLGQPAVNSRQAVGARKPTGNFRETYTSCSLRQTVLKIRPHFDRKSGWVTKEPELPVENIS